MLNTTPRQFTFGNSGTYVLEGPGYFNVDLGIHRNFRLTEYAGLSFRWELFNSFNRANFNAPNTSITAGNDTTGRPLFGQSTTLLPNINAPSRQAEFAVRFQF